MSGIQELQTVVFRTSDGTEFTDRAKAEAHENVLGILDLIVQYAQAKSDSPRAHTRTVNLITEWEQYKACGGNMEVAKVVPQPKKEKAAEADPVAGEEPTESGDEAEEVSE